ncbi:MAG: DUF2889 domain-containing protein [Alphaproteobacteria bacterium]
MPLSSPAAREHIHNRTVECKGYRREDGLWDIEGRLVDVKTYTFHNNERGDVPPGEPVHEMWIRLTVDDDMKIHGVEATTEYSPFSVCKQIAPNFERLVGVSIGPGWRKRVRDRVGGVEGCTHIVEMLGPVATTAFQTIYPLKNKERPEGEKTSTRPPRLLNTCHAFRSDGPKVKEFWPDHYDGSADA